MIFYNPQLMTNHRDSTLFMVNQPNEINRYEDHEAAIHFRLEELIQFAIDEGENPQALLEDFLETTYTQGETISEAADFLMHSDKMQLELWKLKNGWNNLDSSIPQDSLMHNSGMGKQETLEQYASITLRSFLETLNTADD